MQSCAVLNIEAYSGSDSHPRAVRYLILQKLRSQPAALQHSCVANDDKGTLHIVRPIDVTLFAEPVSRPTLVCAVSVVATFREERRELQRLQQARQAWADERIDARRLSSGTSAK
jgi:hypothetical protein